MKVIKCLVEDIQEELESAEHYAKKATEHKDDDRELADVYAKLANTELEHVNNLHGQVVRIIKAWKAETGKETPVAMEAVRQWEHDRMVDTAARVKSLLDVYKGL